MKKLGLLVAVATIVATIAAGTAGAVGTPPNVFLCYSTYQTDPGVWASVAPVPASANVSAAQLLARGYWLPMAEKTVPTKTYLGNGWYLNCNFPGKFTQGVTTSSTWVDEGGNAISDPAMIKDISQGAQGYYPAG